MTCADPENFLWREGGGGVQIPIRGLTENFNMAKINNLAIPGLKPLFLGRLRPERLTSNQDPVVQSIVNSVFVILMFEILTKR